MSQTEPEAQPVFPEFHQGAANASAMLALGEKTPAIAWAQYHATMALYGRVSELCDRLEKLAGRWSL